MPSDSTLIVVAAISAGASGGFALLGVTTANWLTVRRERRASMVEAALLLAQTERLTWEDSFQELSAHLNELEARLIVVDVPQDLIDVYRSLCRECYRDNQRSVLESGGEHTGMDAQLLDAQHALHRAIQGHLLRRERARALARADDAAIEQAQIAKQEHRD